MNFDKIKEIINYEANAILKLPIDENYSKALEILYQRVHKEGGKVVASGMGKAGQIALNIATTLSSTGTPSVFLHAADAQHGDLGVIQKNDVLLFVSNSGKTKEIISLLDLARNLYSDLPLILITGNPEGVLSKMADALLLTGNPKEVCPLGLTPTTSTTVMTVIGDILVSQMILKIGFTAEQYAKRHHSGYLGEKSRNISQKND